MSAFTFEGVTYTVGLNQAETALLSERLSVGRSLSKVSVAGEAERNGDRLAGDVLGGDPQIAPLLAAVGREGRRMKVAARLLFLVGIGVALLCMVALAETFLGLAPEGWGMGAITDVVVMAAVAAAGANMAMAMRSTLSKPVLDRMEAFDELLGKSSVAVGVGYKGVYVGCARQDEWGGLKHGVRIIPYDEIGDVNERQGCLCIEDTSGSPLLMTQVGEDRHGLRHAVEFARRRICS